MYFHHRRPRSHQEDEAAPELPVCRGIGARMARGEAAMPAAAVCAFLTALLACSSAHGKLNASALNAALAFEPYRDLATGADPGARRQNVLFSPLGLASALALLCQVSGSESRSQALEALGLPANASQQSLEATVAALTHLQLRLQQKGGGASEAGIGGASQAGIGGASTAGIGGASTAGIGGTSKAGIGGASNPGIGGTSKAGIGGASQPGIGGAGRDDGGRSGLEDGSKNGTWLKVWSGLHVDGKPAADFQSFLLSGRFNTSHETLIKDLQDSDKLILNNYVYFKGVHPFERRHTVLRSFQLNATSSLEVPMMFLDDQSEVMMLYDTNCSATVVRLPGPGPGPGPGRPASLLLLPKAELQPLEDCLSNGRMNFWLNNLKPGRAEIRFPKFQLRKSYGLERLLRNAGVSSVFSRSANFSGISQKKTLELIEARHEVLLEVEETESENGGRPDVLLDFSVPPRITFDRPFMLIIYDDLSGLVLLIGRIIDPTEV